MQDFQALGTTAKRHPGKVAARSAEALDETRRDGICTGQEHNRGGFGCCLCCKGRWGIESDDYRHVTAQQFLGQQAQAVGGGGRGRPSKGEPDPNITIRLSPIVIARLNTWVTENGMTR
jgi:hypothetical protein